MSIGIILGVFIALSLVVFLHEFGHFAVCKLTGIRVLRFAFGFGPEIIGITRGDTRYSLCAFPLGGFVKPAGEDPEEMSGAPGEFFAASWQARTLVALAGPFMNYVLAFFIFWLAFSFFGLPDHSKESLVGVVLQGSPAEQAGVLPGDRVTGIVITKSAQEKQIVSWDELSDLIHHYPNEALKLRVQRDSRNIDLSVQSGQDPASGIGLIGIAPATVYVKVGPFKACALSAEQLVRWSTSTLSYLAKRIWHREKLGLSGPVGIVQMMGKAAKSGWDDFLGLLAVVSVAIGLFNLFPIPLLDGGHVLFYLWEGISRRKLTRKFLIRGNAVGMVILVPIFLLAFYNDIERIVVAKSKKAKTEFQEILKK